MRLFRLLRPGPGTDVGPIYREISGAPSEPYTVEEHIFECCDSVDTPLSALQKYANAKQIDMKVARIGVLFVVSDSNLEEEGVKKCVARVIRDLDLRLMQYAIVVAVSPLQSERQRISLEDELWRHVIRQERNGDRELVVVYEKSSVGAMDDVVAVIRNIRFGALAPQRNTGSGPLSSVGTAAHSYHRNLSSSTGNHAVEPMRPLYAADTVIVRQQWPATTPIDEVSSLENVVRRQYARGAGTCRFCHKYEKYLAQHLSRYCSGLAGIARPDNPRTIACAVDNALLKLTISKLLVDADVLPLDFVFPSGPVLSGATAPLLPTRVAIGRLAFERLASLSLQSKCPLCDTFSPGLWSTVSGGLSKHIEKEHFALVRDAIVTSLETYKSRFVSDVVKETLGGRMRHPEGVSHERTCKLCPTRKFATNKQLVDHICGLHGTQAALRNDAVHRNRAITLAACGVLLYDERSASGAAANDVLAEMSKWYHPPGKR